MAILASLTQRSIREALAVFGITCLMGILGWQAFLSCGFRVNLTESAPVGIYHVSLRGNYLGFCPQGAAAQLSAERGYRTRAWFACADGRAELIKPIVAQAGDTVSVSTQGVAVNGQRLSDSTPLRVDRAGRVLVAYPSGEYRVQCSQFWVVSHHPQAFDSRYFGPVPAGEHLQFLGGW